MLELAGALRLRRGRHQPGPLRLHLGCGERHLEGWLNIDLEPGPGVDLVRDITRGLPWREVEAIFAEHFLEHLAVDQAVDLLADAHRALRPGGLLRLTTPNLDWIWSTHLGSEPGRRPLEAALHANRAFSAWGHRFLWSRELLAEVLIACGFDDLHWCAPGESRLEVLAGLEGHETYGDAPGLAHVLIVECRRGSGPAGPAGRLDALKHLIQNELLTHMAATDAPRHARAAWWADRLRRRSRHRRDP